MNIAILFAVTSAALWGGGQVIAKRGLEDTSIAMFGFVRSLSAFLFVIPFGLLTTGFPLPSIFLLVVAILGGALDSFVGTLLYMTALRSSPAHEVVPLANTAPFWGVMAAVLFLGEAPRIASFIAAALVIVGAYFLSSRRARLDVPGSRSGPWIALAAGAIWGIAEVAPSKYCLTHGMAASTYQLMIILGSAVGWGGYLLVRHRGHAISWSRKGLGIAVLTAFTNLFLGWLLWLLALGRAPASLISPMRGLVVLFGFLASILLLKENPSKRSAVGVVLIIAGVTLVSLAW
ncbi:MAG TPA: DMT family transporter [Candidatus Acetothermia bacterium]|nr:DMT family transporter [Candidatus Acetothermia bacterium]